MDKNKPLMQWDINLNLLKTPYLVLSIYKVFLIAASSVPFLLLILDIFDGHLTLGRIQVYLSVYLLLAVIFLLLTLISYYLIFIPFAGARYELTFILGPHKAYHLVRDHQRKKNRLFFILGMAAGSLAGKPGLVGANLLAQARQSMVTPYKNVRKIIYYKRKHYVKLIGKDLTRNALFMTAENEKDVMSILRSHCPHASYKEGL